VSNPTAAKVAEQIKTIAAGMLQRRIEDPRLGFLTITDVRLSRDWRRCELFYTVWGEAEAWARAAAGLEAVKGQIRTQVARNLKLRFAPEIVFRPDAVPQLGAQLEAALEAARQSDARVADLARGAEYAGDPDPYKADSDDSDDDQADWDSQDGDGWDGHGPAEGADGPWGGHGPAEAADGRDGWPVPPAGEAAPEPGSDPTAGRDGDGDGG
jgi:ribosome-binding factor A